MSKLKAVDFTDIPIPVSRNGIAMIAPGSELKCVTNDFVSVVEDLLNDGDHGKYAVFKYTPEFHDMTNVPILSELWTAGWWKRQQAELGVHRDILVPIFYMDETPVTYNGRNMHPIYFSLGNLHNDFRLYYQ